MKFLTRVRSAETGSRLLTRVVLWTILQQHIRTVKALGAGNGNTTIRNLYTVCPRELTISGQHLVTLTGRSPLDCASRCARLTSCTGLSVCPVDKGQDPNKVQCNLLQQSDSRGCVGLDPTAVPSSCWFMHKVSIFVLFV